MTDEGDQIRAQLPTESDSDYNAYVERMRQERLRKLQEEKEKGPEFANIQLRGTKAESNEVTSPRKEEPTPEWVAKATQKREIVDPRAGREYNPKEERDVTAPWAKEKILKHTVRTKEPSELVKPPSALNEPKAEIVKKGVASGGENPWGVSLRRQRDTPPPDTKKTSDRPSEPSSKQLKPTSSGDVPRSGSKTDVPTSSASNLSSPSSSSKEPSLSKEEEEQIDREIKEEIERQQRELRAKKEAQEREQQRLQEERARQQQQQTKQTTSRTEEKKAVASSSATTEVSALSGSSGGVSEAEYNELLERVKALETFMETAQKLLNELTEENSTLRAELKKANDTNESLEKKVQSLQDILDHL